MLREKFKKKKNHFLKKIIPLKIFWIIKADILKFAKLSYSQEGEDMILARIFENKIDGFYVDIGAHHPQRFSNTMHFYNKGWRGINIDATPGSMKAFLEIRPRDINLELPVSDKAETLTYFLFNEPALNTFSNDLAKDYEKLKDYFIVQELLLTTKRLDTILEEHLPQNTNIEFLSIDVEGFDINVIKSNNWIKFKPKVVLIEFLEFEIHKFLNSELFHLMSELGYLFYAKTTNTVFFKIKE